MHVHSKKHHQVHWDTVNVSYPVGITPSTGVSSESIARKWRTPPELIHEKLREPSNDIREYSRDHRTCKELRQSQTSLDYGFKISENNRFNKHTQCMENKYIHPPSRRLKDQPPDCRAHGTTEMKESYASPKITSRSMTDKYQFEHGTSLENDSFPVESSLHKELEPIDTTHEGYEKYLDQYLSTSRLHHRPYTTAQLKKKTNTRDIVTYYTLADVPWVWSTKPKHDDTSVGVKRPKSMFDREKFKGDFRETRIHNKLLWVPGSFRTEVRDNYTLSEPKLEYQIDKYEEKVRTAYQRSIAKLKTNINYENLYIQRNYASENSRTGSKKPLCSVFAQ